jgi:radical SAM superfamily enzyme YgiQ (UPF0313 family)
MRAHAKHEPRLVWIDTLVDYPIHQDLTGTRLFNSSYDISLPLALVYLRTHLLSHWPQVQLIYHPRRLYQAMGRSCTIDDLVADGDVVLTSCSTADAPDARLILEAAKRAGKTTIIGGIYPKFSYSEVLAWGSADYIVTGEGEGPLLAIMDELAGGGRASARRPGLVTADQPLPGKQALVDLASLAQPTYAGLPIAEYLRYMRSAYILATRGCPAPCHFCTSARLYGYSYRTRPIPSILEELRQLWDLGFSRITLADDTIAADRKWALALFRAVARANPGYRLKIRARADELSPLLLDTMVEAGVEVVQFGVESINLTTREFMHKQLGQQAICTAFEEILRRDGLVANPLYMLAYPGETWADLEANAAFIKAVGSNDRVISYLSFTTPYPGTGFDRSARTKGRVLTDELKFYTNKFPVFLPSSLLTEPAPEALQRLVAVYDDLASAINRYHPIHHPIPRAFFNAVGADNGW